MKSSEFKKIVKSAVKEAIQEELKDILFESFKSQKNISPITENIQYNQQQQQHLTSPQPEVSLADKRAKYEEALNGTQLNFTSNDVQSFNPQPGADAINGSLGGGSVSMDQITNLMGR
tara:strand:+ start:10015 stop:10368 length:354 start_codon:yes stop_codon:yes gene_type:complete